MIDLKGFREDKGVEDYYKSSFSLTREEGEIENFIDNLEDAFNPVDMEKGETKELGTVRIYLGPSANKRLILSHHKNLNAGDFLIDDRIKNGVNEFKGEHLHFGTPKFPDWNAVVAYLDQRT